MLTTLAGGRILAERFGAPPYDVVALHGWGRSGADFAPLLGDYSALAVHLPGFGPAPAPETAWSTADYAAWLSEGLSTEHPVILVGHSFGGRVAIRVAEAFPQLVRGLVLTGVPLRPKSSSGKKSPLPFRLAKALRRWKLVPESLVDSLRDRYGSADYRAATGVMRDVLVRAVNEDYTDALEGLSMPVHLVWGEGDVPAPVSLAQDAVQRTPSHRLSVVSGSGHLLDEGLFRELHRVIDDMVASENTTGEK